MGLRSAFNEWRNTRYEQHVTQMKEGDKCPDCFGRGFLIYPSTGMSFHSSLIDCPGCDGSGHYSAWESNGTTM